MSKYTREIFEVERVSMKRAILSICIEFYFLVLKVGIGTVFLHLSLSIYNFHDVCRNERIYSYIGL